MAKAYSQDLRDRVIMTYDTDVKKISSLSILFKISVNTIRIWINRYEATGDYTSKQGVGCGMKPKFTNKQAVLGFLRLNPDASAIDIRDAVSPSLPMNTFYDSLHRMGITYKKKSQNINKGMNTVVSNFWSN